jgi:hypothetical protein
LEALPRLLVVDTFQLVYMAGLMVLAWRIIGRRAPILNVLIVTTYFSALLNVAQHIVKLILLAYVRLTAPMLLTINLGDTASAVEALQLVGRRCGLRHWSVFLPRPSSESMPGLDGASCAGCTMASVAPPSPPGASTLRCSWPCELPSTDSDQKLVMPLSRRHSRHAGDLFSVGRNRRHGSLQNVPMKGAGTILDPPHRNG